MVETVGKKLHQARLKRGLTIDEAAHATKLRPDKIAALENDDYTRFANNTYARGFLQIYARYLGVDVSDFARTLDNANPISVSEYQYLSNAPVRREEPTILRHEERQPPSLAPLLFFILLIGLGAGGYWFSKTYERVQAEQGSRTSRVAGAPSDLSNADAEFVTGTPPPLASPPKMPSATPLAARVATATPGVITPIPVTAATPAPMGSEQDFIKPSPVATSDPAARPPGVNEVLVASVKKTWVTVRKDDPKAPPIFEDYVYPDANPLKLKGARFFIEARDPAAVQITKNGLPFAYQPGGAPVQ